MGRDPVTSSRDEEGCCERQYDEVSPGEGSPSEDSTDGLGAEDANDEKSSPGVWQAERKTTATFLDPRDHDTDRVESRVLFRVRSSISVSTTSPGVRLVCRARTTNLGRQQMTGMSRRQSQNWAVSMACCITQKGFCSDGES